MFNGWKEALAEWGWTIPTVLVLVLAGFMAMQYSKSTRLLPTSVLPGNTTTIIARAPGVDFPVVTFCNDPKTVVQGASYTYITDSTWNYKYVLTNGNESVEWLTVNKQDPNAQNTQANHYVMGPDGKNITQPQVEMTKDAVACIYKKGGVPRG